MKVAFGMKAHSGWAALVVVGARSGKTVIVDKNRMTLVDDESAKQPYHAAQGLKPDAARVAVGRGLEGAHQTALREMRAAVTRERERGNDVSACAVLVGTPMPDWTVEEILAVHFRMHKAEGALFRDVLVRAARSCNLQIVEVPEKLLASQAEHALRRPAKVLLAEIAKLGKPLGSPWGKDQKDAALAALVALRGRQK